VRLCESSKLLSHQTQNHSPGVSTINKTTQSNSLLVDTVDSDVSMVDSGIETALNDWFFNTADFIPGSVDDDDDDDEDDGGGGGGDNGHNTGPLSQSVDGSPSLLSHYQVTTDFCC